MATSVPTPAEATAPVITGTGRCLPDDVLSNDDVAVMADPARLDAWVTASTWCKARLAEEPASRGSPDALHRRIFAEYIERRIGIRTRRVIDRAALLAGRPSSRDVHAADLGAVAAREALDRAGVSAQDVDVVVVGTSTPGRIYPATAVQVQSLIGAERAYAFDVSAACSSFVYGLELVRGLLRSGAARRALVVAAEYFTAGVDYRDPTFSYFFGDAGAAAVVEAGDLARGKPGWRIVDVRCRSQWSRNIRTGLGGTETLVAARAAAARGETDPAPGDAASPWFFQNGPSVYRDVVPLVARETLALLEGHRLRTDDVRLFLFHQASALMLDGIQERLFGAPLAPERIVVNLERYGNTSSCGVALGLAEEKTARPGDLACLATFGAGYTLGAALLRKV